MERIRLLQKENPLARMGSRGQGLIEYCLILLLATLVVIATVTSVGESTRNNMYEPVNNAVTNAMK